MKAQDHNVSIQIGSSVLERWSEYEISCDMLQAADAFRIALPGARRAVWQLVKPDADLAVFIDGVKVLTGFIDDRKYQVGRGGSFLTITGRDRAGRLVDESMPLTSFNGLGIKQLAEQAAGIGDAQLAAAGGPWFPKVLLSNAKNRRLLVGDDAYVADVSSEPAIDQGEHARKKVNPGESRWQTLAAFLEEAELLAWAAADGSALIVGLPNYAQQAQYKFFAPMEGSARKSEGNLISLTLDESAAERYSEIIAVGSGRGNKENYSDKVTQRRGRVTNGSGPGGTGKDFARRKQLIVSDDDVRDNELADVRAAREMGYRDATGRKIGVAQGHSQRSQAGVAPALFAFDTVSDVEIEELQDRALWYATGISFRHSRMEGETTELGLVPLGTALKA